MVGDFFFILLIFFFFLWSFFFKKKSPFSTLSSRCASVGKPLWRPIRVLERVPEYIHPMHKEKRRGGNRWNEEIRKVIERGECTCIPRWYCNIGLFPRDIPGISPPSSFRNEIRNDSIYIYIYILGGIAIEPKRYDYSSLVSPTVFWLRPKKKCVLYISLPEKEKHLIDILWEINWNCCIEWEVTLRGHTHTTAAFFLFFFLHMYI